METVSKNSNEKSSVLNSILSLAGDSLKKEMEISIAVPFTLLPFCEILLQQSCHRTSALPVPHMLSSLSSNKQCI